MIYVAAVIATIVLILTESAATGAPQEAAGAALALAIAVIPYVVTATLQRDASLRSRATDD